MTAVLEDLRAVDDTGLLDAYRAADDAAARAVLAEARRRDVRDRLDRGRRVLAAIRHEAECAVHAQYLAASEETRGRLLSREGMAAGIAERDLWRMPASQVARFGSEELTDYFTFIQPRITVAAYIRQHAAENRMARTEARDLASSAGLAEDITEWGAIADDEQHTTGPGLAGDEPGAFRHVPPAAEAPAAAGGRIVQRGGYRPGTEAAGEHAAAGARRAGGPAQPSRGVTTMTSAFVTFAEIDPLPTEPLWPGFWPRGEVVGWFGEGGLGKGRSELDLAARITRGDPMPFCTGQSRPGSVILILPEDHPSEQIRPRLDAAGADVSRVIEMTRLVTGSRFKLSAAQTKDGDVGLLREAIETLKATCAECREQMAAGRCPACGGTEDMNPRLVIIDPLSAVIGHGSISTVAGARRAIEPLQDVAASTGVTILLVMHCTKDGQLQGSAGVKQALRLLYRISKDVNPMVRVIALDKANNQGETPDAKFTLEDTGDGVKVIWLDRLEQDRRARSWRELPAPVPPAAPAAPTRPALDPPGRKYAAVLGTQRPGEDRAEVTVLKVFPGDERGARLARLRCEIHPEFRRDAPWQAGQGGELLSKFTGPGGARRWFAVTQMTS